MDTDDIDKPNDDWDISRAVTYTSIFSGVTLWVLSLIHGGESTFLTIYFFFVAIPVTIVISAIAIFLIILPAAIFLKRINHLNPIKLTLVGLMSGLLAIFLYPHLIFIERLVESWWAFIWLGSMALVFSLTVTTSWIGKL